MKVCEIHGRIRCGECAYIEELENENRCLKKEIEKQNELMADLIFAYLNKEENLPHSFEINAIKDAVNYLLQKYKGSKYNEKFFLNVLKKIEKY